MAQIQVPEPTTLVAPTPPPARVRVPPAAEDHVLHTQVNPAIIWTVVHNKGYNPGPWMVRDLDGNIRNPKITDLSPNVTLFEFLSPVAGTAEAT